VVEDVRGLGDGGLAVAATASITSSTASSPSFCATLAVPRERSRAECEAWISPSPRRASMVL
jgi:hypothetical protein